MRKILQPGSFSILLTGLYLMVPAATWSQDKNCLEDSSEQPSQCNPMEQVTILGQSADVRDVTGGANLILAEDLQELSATDVVRAIRMTPGVSLQAEDGYGLRPNISIRGTATERSSRITLMEDNILISPAPYTAPSAYYFPTFGRINSIEVLKGPSSVTQGPYTVGGAINLVSTPIPEEMSGHLTAEAGSDATWRAHAWYGGTNDAHSFLVETHQWQSDGYQTIDRSNANTGLDKQDYLAKYRYQFGGEGAFEHSIELRAQASSESSQQSYLGLTDNDFGGNALRRYGASVVDEMDNEHSQLAATWNLQHESGLLLSLTAYNNDFERAWYKTEGIDFDGSDDAQSFQRTSWSHVINAVNNQVSLGAQTPAQLQAILDGADTAPGSIQVRNNSREYYSRGIQLTANQTLSMGETEHHLQAGIRLHEDEEDRLQRNDSFQQLAGQLILSDTGLEGNAGNRIQNAEALAVYVQDRIEFGQWTIAPGLRYENIDLSRIDYDTSADDPGSRDPSNLKGTRENNVDVWIPGVGLLYDFDGQLRLVAGVHRGFAVPGNKPGVNPEESTNYELGLRYNTGSFNLDLMGFFNDYENLVGICTNSSGTDCEPGDSFNGEGAHIPGVELSLSTELSQGGNWYFPLKLAYTWMDAKFQSDFDSDFFGKVSKGDPVPYIPEHQLWASAGIARGEFSAFLGMNFVDDVCTQAACGPFQSTESATVFDLAAHYRLQEQLELYAVVENLTEETYIAGREPYGARPGKARSYSVGVRYGF